MTRPKRIEYPNAAFHVMNRGRNHQNLFHDSNYYEQFLRCIGEAHDRYGVEVHAYCLMSNHYHLLLRTPQCNLSRVMRHINGVYTQRYHKLTGTDGSIMRGRYKALLVDQEVYWLQLSRYIHRNPIEATPPLVQRLDEYQWSSYPAYRSRADAPWWLYLDETLNQFGTTRKRRAYKQYVDRENDATFVDKLSSGRNPPVIGDEEYLERLNAMEDLRETIDATEVVKASNLPRAHVSIDWIINQVALYYRVDKTTVTSCSENWRSGNTPRAVALYLCRHYTDIRLKEVADVFNMCHYSSAASAVTRLKQRLTLDPVLESDIAALALRVNAKT